MPRDGIEGDPDENFNVASRRDRCIISAIFEAKKEIPLESKMPCRIRNALAEMCEGATLFLAAALALFSFGCAGGGISPAPAPTPTPTPQVSVVVTPAAPNVVVGTGQQFTASVTGTTNTAVTWQVAGIVGGNATLGTIDLTGFYQPPATLPTPSQVMVRAVSAADITTAGNATVLLSNPVPTIINVQPSSFSAGAFTITVNGTNFVSAGQVLFGTTVLRTQFVSPTQLTASGYVSQPGAVTVQVKVPDPGSTTSNTAQVTVNAASVPKVSASAAARFLEQATFGPTAGSITRVQELGFDAFLEEQFNTPPSGYADPTPRDMGLGPVQYRFFSNAVGAPDQLRQRVSLALGEMFVISGRKMEDSYAFVPYLRMLSNDAFGNYYDLLKDVTLSPAMGRYLDMVNNDKPDPVSKVSPNENYAREILQLFSIGVSQLNPDGSLQLDASGKPKPTYSQDTIEGFAHLFTGWTYPTMPGNTLQIHNPDYWNGPMEIYESNHDNGPKNLLNGVVLPAGQTADKDLTDGLQNIFNHPNVSPFVSIRLIRQLVTSNPSPAYVGRVASVFNNASGVRGNLKEVIKAILLDPEARRDVPAQTQANDGHLKEPALFTAGVLRALNAQTDGFGVTYFSALMRQDIFFSPNVFNYYPPNYKIVGSSLYGPEFKISNTPTALAHANFVTALLFGALGNTQIDITEFVAAAGDANQLIDQLNLRLMHGHMSADVRQALLSAINSLPAVTPQDIDYRARAGIFLVATSSQYQVMH